MLKKNVCIILFLIIFLLFFFSLNVHASPYIDDIINEEYPYYIIFQNPETKVYYCVISKITSTCQSYSGNETVFWNFNTGNVQFYVFDTAYWKKISIDNIPSLKWRSGTAQLQIYYDRDYGVNFKQCLKFSNSNIIDHESQEIFFQLTPSKGYLTTTQVTQAISGVELGGVLMEIVKILTLILVVVVSLIGLRKAWKLLSTLLHQA